MILEQFEKHIEQIGCGPSAKYYLSDLRKFARWLKRDITSALKSDLIKYLEYLLDFGGRSKTKAKISTVNRALISLSIFFKWALDQRLIKANPAEELELLKEAASPPEWLSKEDQSKFMHAVHAGQNIRDIAICNLMLYAGLQVSEICSLKPGDFILKKGSGQVIVRAARGRDQRVVPLDDTLQNMLSSYIKKSSAVLFESQKGGTLTPRGIQYMIKRYAHQANLENVTPRALCNTFRNNLLQSGTNLEKAAELAGHLTPNTIKRYLTLGTDNRLQK